MALDREDPRNKLEAGDVVRPGMVPDTSVPEFEDKKMLGADEGADPEEGKEGRMKPENEQLNEDTEQDWRRSGGKA